jgi:hypothetical protein
MVDLYEERALILSKLGQVMMLQQKTTRHPKPETRSPKPETQNSKPETETAQRRIMRLTITAQRLTPDGYSS